MPANPFLGVFLHSLGGLAAGSFYIPFRRVLKWAWESYWLIQGVLAWIVSPWVFAALTVPGVGGIVGSIPLRQLAGPYVFGALWGIGGLTFGLTMRYLGMSLGYAVALGFCAAFGTLVPAVAEGKLPEMLTSASGLVALAGVAVCLGGIALCGYAGVCKERELTDEEKRATVREFALAKGFAVAVFSGVMSACMSYGIRAGAPIADAAVAAGAPDVFKNNPVFIVVMAGGFTTNLIWCLSLNMRNRTIRDYVTGSPRLLAANYSFAGLAGVIWYGQFFFYGMGTTKMGRYDFSSWTIHMAFIIVFSNLWGILFREWRGTSHRTHLLVWAGIAVLVLSTVVIGYGNYLAA